MNQEIYLGVGGGGVFEMSENVELFFAHAPKNCSKFPIFGGSQKFFKLMTLFVYVKLSCPKIQEKV